MSIRNGITTIERVHRLVAFSSVQSARNRFSSDLLLPLRLDPHTSFVPAWFIIGKELNWFLSPNVICNNIRFYFVGNREHVASLLKLTIIGEFIMTAGGQCVCCHFFFKIFENITKCLLYRLWLINKSYPNTLWCPTNFWNVFWNIYVCGGTGHL